MSSSSTGSAASLGSLAQPLVDNPTTADALSLFLVQLLIILVLVRILAKLLAKMRQPPVIGEILAGIILGPTAMGYVPGFSNAIFPASSLTVITVFAQVGLIFFMFFLGLEVDISLLTRNWRAAAPVAIVSIIIPFSVGAGISIWFYNIEPTVADQTTFLLFMGTSMAFTAFPVLARILTSFRLLDTGLGVHLLSIAAIDDVLAWCVLALTLSYAGGGPPTNGLVTMVMVIGFVIVLVFIIRPALVIIGKWFYERNKRKGLPEDEVNRDYVALLFFLLTCASIWTEIINVHAFFGAFAFGIIVPKEHGLVDFLGPKIELLVVEFFLPLYFVQSGLSTTLGALNTGQIWGQTIALIILATAAKLLPVMFMTRLTSMIFYVDTTDPDDLIDDEEHNNLVTTAVTDKLDNAAGGGEMEMLEMIQQQHELMKTNQAAKHQPVALDHQAYSFQQPRRPYVDTEAEERHEVIAGTPRTSSRSKSQNEDHDTEDDHPVDILESGGHELIDEHKALAPSSGEHEQTDKSPESAEGSHLSRRNLRNRPYHDVHFPEDSSSYMYNPNNHNNSHNDDPDTQNGEMNGTANRHPGDRHEQPNHDESSPATITTASTAADSDVPLSGGDGVPPAARDANGKIIPMPWIMCFIIGVMMNTRGLVALIALNIGRQKGILGPKVFSMMVLMAVVTTFITSPIFDWLFYRPYVWPKRKAREQRRREKEKAERGEPPVSESPADLAARQKEEEEEQAEAAPPLEETLSISVRTITPHHQHMYRPPTLTRQNTGLFGGMGVSPTARPSPRPEMDRAATVGAMSKRASISTGPLQLSSLYIRPNTGGVFFANTPTAHSSSSAAFSSLARAVSSDAIHSHDKRDDLMQTGPSRMQHDRAYYSAPTVTVTAPLTPSSAHSRHLHPEDHGDLHHGAHAHHGHLHPHGSRLEAPHHLMATGPSRLHHGIPASSPVNASPRGHVDHLLSTQPSRSHPPVHHMDDIQEAAASEAEVEARDADSDTYGGGPSKPEH